MRSYRTVATGVIAAGLVLVPPFTHAQTSDAPPQMQRQIEPPPPAAAGSQDDDTTLELPSRQIGASPRENKAVEIPELKRSVPDADNAPERPYLGITTRQASRCYLGGEEYGMEIVSVDPGSPAAKAGLRGISPVSHSNSSGFRHQLDVALHTLRSLADPPESDGDLIVAINDQRVRMQPELDEQMRELKPGDTIYLTVIRPVNSVKHETLKILVHVGRWSDPVAAAAAAPQ